MSTSFWQWLKALNLFRVLGKETLEMLWEMLEIVCEKNAKTNTNLVGLTSWQGKKRLVCKLHYLYFGFLKDRSRRSQMYFRLGTLKDFPMFTEKYLCWSLFLINIQAWRPATLLKRDSNICVFLWNFRNFLQGTPSGYFWKYLMNSVFITFENNEWGHFVIRVSSPVFISFCCLCFISFYFFFFFFFAYFSVDSTHFWFWGKFINT